MTGELVKIELNEKDCELFRQFREYQDVFQHLVKAGVFETRNGVAILNFDSAGTLTEIRKDILTYKRVALVVEKIV